jgi:hypothetical protein
MARYANPSLPLVSDSARHRDRRSPTHANEPAAVVASRSMPGTATCSSSTDLSPGRQQTGAQCEITPAREGT